MIIIGNWRRGYALDMHTSSSTFIGYDEYGHERYDTRYTTIGALLHRLKYKGDLKAVEDIVDATERLMSNWKPNVDVLVPVPPTNARKVQPVLILAEAISKRMGIPLANCVKRSRHTPQLKKVFDLDERTKLLEGLHVVEGHGLKAKSVLLFDDLYRSGATMNSVSAALYESGGARDVYALTVTATRRNR